MGMKKKIQKLKINEASSPFSVNINFCDLVESQDGPCRDLHMKFPIHYSVLLQVPCNCARLLVSQYFGFES